MNDLESQLHYPLGDALAPLGGALVVAPGVKWVRMGLPFALDHINLWLLRDEMDDPAGSGARIQGWSIVDCCIHHDAAKAQWIPVQTFLGMREQMYEDHFHIATHFLGGHAR